MQFCGPPSMEGLNEYRRGFARKGGAFEIIGLDAHTADTQHPFAIRKSLPANDFFKINNNLTKRQLSLQKLSTFLVGAIGQKPRLTQKNLSVLIFLKQKL